MPSEGKVQKSAGIDVSDKCIGIDNSTKTMIAGKIFKIEPQKYKGNAVLNANK